MSVITRETRDDIAFVYFSDAKILDAARIDSIGAELRETIESPGVRRLVLNFRGVTFMSSGMITKLVTVERSCRKRGIGLRLCEIAQPVMEVFKITNLTRLFEICDSEEQAIVSFELKS
jgi:anti-sigma B factor antagonist